MDRTIASRLVLVFVLVLAAGAYAQQGTQRTEGKAPRPRQPATSPHAPGEHVMVTATELKWVPAPDALPRGAEVAVLEGDPAKEGPFTMRARVPSNYRIPPHWHPSTEHVTVLSGTVYMGTGDTLDEERARRLPAGSFVALPPKSNHFFFTRDEGAEIQLHGVGPWGITYVNPADDPRRATARPRGGAGTVQ